MTITEEQREAIAQYVGNHHLPSGLGNEEAACSIAAINLALTGELTDTIPDCMSAVIGQWIIRVQDAMPDALRNSAGWKALLPLAAGTGRELEKERLALVMSWMWETVLPTLQPTAEKYEAGDAWTAMCSTRTEEAAEEAARAVRMKIEHWVLGSPPSIWASYAAAAAADALGAHAAQLRADAVGSAAQNVGMVEVGAWTLFDPVGLLRRLIEVEGIHV